MIALSWSQASIRRLASPPRESKHRKLAPRAHYFHFREYERGRKRGDRGKVAKEFSPRYSSPAAHFNEATHGGSQVRFVCNPFACIVLNGFFSSFFFFFFFQPKEIERGVSC